MQLSELTLALEALHSSSSLEDEDLPIWTLNEQGSSHGAQRGLSQLSVTFSWCILLSVGPNIWLEQSTISPFLLRL